MTNLTLADGLKLLRQKQYQTVHSQSIKLIEENVRNPLPYFLLGIIAEEHDNYAKAPELYAKAAELGPDVPYFHIYHAKVLSTLGRQNDAKANADKASKLAISDASLADTIGVVYSRAGYHELAIPFFEKAVSFEPDQANFHYNFAASAQFLGDFETAKHEYQRAVGLDGNHFRAWTSLTSMEKQTEQANQLPMLRQLFNQAEDDAEGRLQLGHAIAKTLEDMGQYEASFEWLLKAKEAKRSELRYDREAGRAMFESAKQTFVSNPKNAAEDPEDTPIFVVGLPRTGTTLVDRILSSHTEVVSAGELNVFAELVKEAAGTSTNMVMDDETFQRASVMDVSGIGASYISRNLERVQRSKHMVDKMPLNFFYAGLIHRALPNARIISLRRGAMDSCLSNFRQLFSTRYSYYNYTFDLEDTAEFYRLYDDLMAHWRNVLPSDRFLEIHYEDIVFDQEAQTRKLLDFCGLEWDEACMRFHENTAPVSTASSVQVRQPLYSGSIGRWKKYGDKLDNLKTALGDLD
ncbi:sulfotransferase [Parasphingorhabdus sp.]|uniref:tetratricopeptide repeat-containing sulfotransferase family protein n=1 Tax=Parasphingorhabdus sp. TaxID=2709688 RepID=UPI003264E714